jgi:hypothetical protein
VIDRAPQHVIQKELVGHVRIDPQRAIERLRAQLIEQLLLLAVPSE